MRGCAALWPVFFAVCPAYHFLLKQGGWGKGVFWGTGPVVLVAASGLAMAFSMFSLSCSCASTPLHTGHILPLSPHISQDTFSNISEIAPQLTSLTAAVQLALNDIAPSPSSLGTLNAIALAASSGLRAVAPALATTVYAVGVKYRILGGQLFWLCNAVLAVGLVGLVRWLPVKVEGRKRGKKVVGANGVGSDGDGEGNGEARV